MAENNEYDDLVQGPTPDPSQQLNEYVGMVDPAKAEQKAAVQQSLTVAADQDPDKFAKITQLAKKTNLPVDVVARNYDDVAKRTLVAHTDYDKLIDESPTTASWLTQPGNASLAKDDVDNLAQSEKAVKEQGFGHSLYNSLMSGVAGLFGSVSRLPGLAYDIAALPQNLIGKYTGHPEFQTSASKLPFNNTVAQYFEGAQKYYASQAPELSQSIVDSVGKGDYAGAGKALAAQFVASAPTQAAVIASAMMGAPLAGVAGIGLTSAAESEQHGAEAGADPAMNTLNSVSHGIIQAGAAEIGTLGPLKSWEASLAKSFGREASSGVIKNMLSTLSLSATRGAASMGVASAASDVSDYLTGVNPDAIHGIVNRAADAGLVGAASDVGLTAPIALGGHIQNQIMSKRMEQGAQTYEQLGELAKASKLNQRSPEVYQDFMEKITDGQPAQNVYIRPEALESYFQSKKIDPVQASAELGLDPKKLLSAVETGSYLEIPLPKWLSKLANTEHYKALADDVTLSPDVPTANEAKSISADAKARVDQAVAEKAAPAEEGNGKVYDRVIEQLKNAGYDDKTAEHYASLYDAGFKSLGERSGQDPGDLFEKYGLKIDRPTQDFSQPEAHVFEQANRIDGTNVLDASDVFKSKRETKGDPGTEGTGDVASVSKLEPKTPTESRFGEGISEHGNKALESLSARYGDDEAVSEKADKALSKAQKPENGPYVSDKAVKGIGWAPNYAAEPTGEIGPKHISEPNPSKAKIESDPLKWADNKYGATKELIEKHAKDGKPLTINTSSDLVAHDDYIAAMPKDTTVNMYLPPANGPEGTNRLLFPGNPSRDRLLRAADKLKESGVKVNLIESSSEDVAKAIGGMKEVAKRLGVSEEEAKVKLDQATAPNEAEVNGRKVLTDVGKKALQDQINDLKEKVNNFDPKDPFDVDRIDDWKRELGEKTQQLEESERQQKLADSNLKLVSSFEQGGKDEPRGRIRFGESRQFSIDLLKGADLSTFLHETGHFYLEVMHDLGQGENAPAEIKGDLDTIRKWLGAEDGAKLSVDQHEQFARGFEAYLMEGKAPTSALRETFDRFRSWLTEIYRKVKNLNVELTPEVRAVFDRMLATDTEIKSANEDIGQKPLQSEVEDLPPEDVAKLEKLQQRAHEEAVTHLLTQQMEEIRANRKEYLANREAELKEEMAAKVKKERLYQAEEQLREQIGKTPRRKLADDFVNGRMSEEHEALFNTLAEMQGYSSGDELAKEIMSSPTLSEAIKDRVKSEMSVYADMKNTGAIREEALKSVHNERSMELMGLEHEILEGLIKDSAIKEEAKRRKYAEAKIETAAIKDRAHDLMWDLNIKGATNFGPILTDERRAATSLGKALASKDFERAAALKRMQMLNHALAMESIKIGKKVDGWVDFMNGLRTKDAGSFKKEDHFYQVAEILKRLGFPRTDYDPAKKKDSLSQWAQKVQEQTNTLNIPDWVFDESKIKNYQKLSVNDLEDVVNTLKNIQRVASFENRALTIANGASIDEIKGDLTMSAKLGRKGRETQKPAMEPGRFDSIKSLGTKYILSLTKVQTLLRSIQGWSDEGAWTRTFYDPVHEAANHESELMQWANDGLKKLFEGYTKDERVELNNKQVFHPELGTSATKMRLLMMALNMGNEDNRTKLFTTKPVGVEDALEWNERSVTKMLEKNLTEKDWKFVQGTWDLLNERWGDISALHKELTGFTPDKVDAQPFNVTTADGKMITMEGGYFPLKEDPRASVRAATRESLESPLYTEQNPGWSASTSTGHTKARTGAQYSVSLDNSIIYKHLRDVIHDLAFRKVVTDLRRLVMDKELHGVLQDSVGIEGHAMLREWVGAVGQGNTDALSPFEKIVSELRRRTTVAAVVAKASLMTQHIAHAFLFSGAHEDFTFKDAAHGLIVRGLGDYWRKALTDRKGYQDTRDFVFSKSRFMVDKHQNPDLSLYETHAKAFGEDSKIRDFASGVLGSSDELTSIPMWIEAYSKALDTKNMEEDEAVKYADTLIERTIGSGRRYDAPPIQRSDQLSRSLSMFYTFLNSEYNRWRTEYGRTQVDPKYLGKFLGFALGRILVFQTATNLFAMKGPGPEDDKLKWWLKSALMYPMDLLPGVREIAGVAMDDALGLKSYGYKASPASDAIQAMVLNPIHAVKSYSDGNAESAQMMETLTHSMSYILPYPDQFNSWFWNAHDAMFSGMKPKVADLYHRRPKADR